MYSDGDGHFPGFITAILIGDGIGLIGSAFFGSALNVIQTLVDTAIEGKNVNFTELLILMALGLVKMIMLEFEWLKMRSKMHILIQPVLYGMDF